MPVLLLLTSQYNQSNNAEEESSFNDNQIECLKYLIQAGLDPFDEVVDKKSHNCLMSVMWNRSKKSIINIIDIISTHSPLNHDIMEKVLTKRMRLDDTLTSKTLLDKCKSEVRILTESHRMSLVHGAHEGECRVLIDKFNIDLIPIFSCLLKYGADPNLIISSTQTDERSSEGIITLPILIALCCDDSMIMNSSHEYQVAYKALVFRLIKAKSTQEHPNAVDGIVDAKYPAVSNAVCAASFHSNMYALNCLLLDDNDDDTSQMKINKYSSDVKGAILVSAVLGASTHSKCYIDLLHSGPLSTYSKKTNAISQHSCRQQNPLDIIKFLCDVKKFSPLTPCKSLKNFCM